MPTDYSKLTTAQLLVALGDREAELEQCQEEVEAFSSEVADLRATVAQLKRDLVDAKDTLTEVMDARDELAVAKRCLTAFEFTEGIAIELVEEWTQFGPGPTFDRLLEEFCIAVRKAQNG